MGQQRILIVDDDELMRLALTRLLEKHGYDTAVAANGHEALIAISVGGFDLVISDIRMPGMSGMDLLSKLSMDYPRLPVILMTAKASVEDAVASIKIGAADYITKPFDTVKIIDTVRKVLLRRRHPTIRSLDETLAMPGTSCRISGYRVVCKIGEGNMGGVYRVTKAGDATPLALKVMKRYGLTEERNTAAVKRFMNEVMSYRQVDHPNVVRILDHGFIESDNVPYIVMEFIAGKTLNHVGHRNVLDYTTKSRILKQIAAALTAIHEHGIIHRDLKPTNIIVTADHDVKLMDFGIARMPNSDMTTTSKLIGTPIYLSPESYLTAKVDAASDIFSLGTLAYEFLLGQRPFAGNTLPDLAEAIRTSNPMRPQRLRADFPAALEVILAQLLQKQPIRRPDAASVTESLAAFVESAAAHDVDGTASPTPSPVATVFNDSVTT